MTGDQSRAIARRLAEADGLLVGLDFDGTLAPIADDPDAPTTGRACRRALRRLVSRPDATVAVISGRELADLRGRVGVDGIAYAGNHGLELQHGDNTVVHPLAARQRSGLSRALDRLRERLAEVPGVVVEDKGLTGTVHVRRTPSHRVPEVRAAVEAIAGTADAGLQVTTGREVFELRPRIPWDKGSAVEFLADRTSEGWRTVYIGDDVTDEDAFRAVRPDGLGILVGSRDETAATHRLSAQAAVAPFLHWLVDELLERHSATRS